MSYLFNKIWFWTFWGLSDHKGAPLCVSTHQGSHWIFLFFFFKWVWQFQFCHPLTFNWIMFSALKWQFWPIISFPKVLPILYVVLHLLSRNIGNNRKYVSVWKRSSRLLWLLRRILDLKTIQLMRSDGTEETSPQLHHSWPLKALNRRSYI